MAAGGNGRSFGLIGRRRASPDLHPAFVGSRLHWTRLADRRQSLAAIGFRGGLVVRAWLFRAGSLLDCGSPLGRSREIPLDDPLRRSLPIRLYPPIPPPPTLPSPSHPS